jgi:D-alanyl-D-alanine carboxypeptidase/D-alanyl-D-alanine-endopeptidase (penicillin-binding protein 4)
LTRRGRAILRVLGLLFVAIAVACTVVALRDDEPAAATPTATDSRAATSPLLSARRMPYFFTDAAARKALADTLSAYVGNFQACVAVDDPSAPDSPVAAVNADRAFAPASTLKLVTGAAALSVLGPDHTFVTRAQLAKDGNLYLVGGGDPVLTTPQNEQRIRNSARTRTDVITPLASLADAIVANGVKSVPALVADDSRQDDLRFLPEWKPGYTADIGPLGALTVDDGIARGERVTDPALNAGAQLQALLAARGVTVGGVTRGTAPSGAREVGSVMSPPLSDIVASMLTSSDNQTAEMLMREIGLARGGDGSTAAGTRVAADALKELGVDTAGLDLKDGSGLAPANRVTCTTLLGTLELAHDARFAALDRGMPIAGSTGTLAARGDGLEGTLRAKTGYIDDVAGLAGIVDDSEHLRFAFLANDSFSAAGGRAIADQVARLVAAFPQSPTTQVVPAP